MVAPSGFGVDFLQF